MPRGTTLIAFDKRGRYRREVRRFATLMEKPSSLPMEGEKPSRVRFIKNHFASVALLRELLEATPLFSNGEWRLDVEVGTTNLEPFVKSLIARKPLIETQLRQEVRRDVERKPVQQLGRLLSLIGLKLKKRREKQDGEVRYLYRLDPEPLERVTGIVERRRDIGGWASLARIYGWPAEERDDSDDDWDDE